MPYTDVILTTPSFIFEGCHSDDPRLHRGEEEPLPSDKLYNPVLLISRITADNKCSGGSIGRFHLT